MFILLKRTKENYITFKNLSLGMNNEADISAVIFKSNYRFISFIYEVAETYER